MIAVFWILGIMLYLTIGGVSYSHVQSALKPKCEFRGSSYCGGDCGHSILAGLSVFVWPVCWPIIAGTKLTGLSGHGIKSRTDRRREKEIAEAEHNVKVAKLKAEESRYLDKQLERL